MPENEATPRPFLRILAYEEIDSTNAEALRLAGRGEGGPIWIMARRQRAGKGRSGRSWSSDAGNLHASYLALMSCAPATASQLSLVAGVAVADAARSLFPLDAPVELRLKWPNDLLIGRAKAGGILVESMSLAGGNVLAVVIGVGVNVASHPEDLDRPATNLARHGVETEPQKLLERLAKAMAHWLEIWDNGKGFEPVRLAWLERAGPIGEPLSVNAGNGPLHGQFAGLDEDGALLLSTAGGEVSRISYGDVTLSG